jgi:hypothetical protein
MFPDLLYQCTVTELLCFFSNCRVLFIGQTCIEKAPGSWIVIYARSICFQYWG